MLTPRIKLPLIAAQQSQKHVTVNEALMRLDALAGQTALDMVSKPPASPALDGLWIVGADAQGAWTGRQGLLARIDTGAWDFIEPHEGQLFYLTARDEWWRYRIGGWVRATFGVGSLAINVATGQQHALALSGDSSLFDHGGGGHRVVVNKAATSDSATLLFQSGYAGAAEIGLAGDNDLHVKANSDGSAWRDAIIVERSSAIVRTPHRPAFFGGLLNWDTYYNAGDRLAWKARVNRGAMLNGAGNGLILSTSGLYLVTVAGNSRDISSFGSNYLGVYVNDVLSTRTVLSAASITTMVMQVEALAGDRLDVRNIFGTNARYWPETMLNVVFWG